MVKIWRSRELTARQEDCGVAVPIEATLITAVVLLVVYTRLLKMVGGRHTFYRSVKHRLEMSSRMCPCEL